MKKYFMVAAMAVLMVLGVTGCTESQQRELKTIKSEWTGGLERKVTAYDYNGNALYTYTGKVDIEANENKVLFDKEDGKRTVIYNAIVIAEEQ